TEANIEIRQAVPSDAQAIAAIHVASWRAAYANLMPDAYLAGLSVERRILDWRNALESRRLHVALARDADGIAGWI
ncbi:GNAT family N-acetyltransferase, partial [Klebsiella pneumoniae]|nr:GNAT family N-acetyltransferase [Klebsiella pneumoniae]